ncbi:MAG: hypothetical protein KA297_19980 [Kofleriaceae bacterium]|nr:hypothetical protein [Kofleriaceae bacterium]
MSAARPLVVLLHGLARTHTSMAGLGRVLHAHGYDVWARSYPSRRASITEAAREVVDALVPIAADRPLLAVTHSMGGVLIRHMHDPRLRWQRIVMLAPPNTGSRLAKVIAASAPLRWFYGPAGVELADGAAWPAPPAPFAVIAGTRRLAVSNPTSWTMGLRFGRHVAHDGTVAAAETQLPGMAAYAEVDATHTWIMNHPVVHQQVLAFLADGRLPA